jgi:hypothetical protein
MKPVKELLEMYAKAAQYGILMGQGKEDEAQALLDEFKARFMPYDEPAPDNVINLDLKREEIDQIVTQADRDARSR